MVFNSLIVLSVAHLSADAWQYIACIQDRLSSNQLLDLVCCFPLQQLGRFALCLWTFLCLPPPDAYYTYSYSSDSDDSSTAVDYEEYYYNSHSD
ncbi:Serine/threonine-protein kinase pats1 [Quillaja saponaria]|uniref:Serine/threonine-protein kinase pats1 n=1 Tax=Quillaja saponaria TaxID=32244 RepID=A0AAD7PHX7_QUISA|nr:Serine/threonine-protein kinase pats1 [Quillaja saponaria]